MPHSDPNRLSVELEQERYLEALRWRYHELIVSTSWRITAPLRALKRMVRKEEAPKIGSQMLWRLGPRDLEYLIQQIENSRSWRLTSSLRKLMRKTY